MKIRFLHIVVKTDLHQVSIKAYNKNTDKNDYTRYTKPILAIKLLHNLQDNFRGIMSLFSL